MDRRVLVGLIAAASLAACQLTTSGGNHTQSTVPPSSWTTFLHDAQRSGKDDAQPALSSPRLAWTSATLDGEIYAEPLVYANTVFVATENNSLYALTASRGQTRWVRHLGAPVPGRELPCGQIPVVGITSTPVIDPTTKRIYAVGLVEPGVYHLFGLDSTSGNVLVDTPLDLGGIDPKVEGQRGALTLNGDRLLVPFGGRNGDCGAYHGLLLSIPVSGAGAPTAYRVPSGRAAGIWAPGGVTLDTAGQIWAATGNSFATDTYDYANTVVRLSAGMVVQDSWAPKDWPALNNADLDMGSVSPSLIGDSLLFQAGKSGLGYLLNPAHLGGIGGELFAARVCGSAYGSPVYLKPFLYVPCFDGLTTLRVDESARAFSVAWRSDVFRGGSPIVISGAVWILDVDRGVVMEMDASSGQLKWDLHVGYGVHFATPAAGGGCIYVPTQTHISAVGGDVGCA